MFESVSQYDIRIRVSLDDESMQFDRRGSAKGCWDCSVVMIGTFEVGACNVHIDIGKLYSIFFASGQFSRFGSDLAPYVL